MSPPQTPVRLAAQEPHTGAEVSGQCDLCEAPMTIPPGAVRDGQIVGLLTCSACIEDALAARQLEEIQ